MDLQQQGSAGDIERAHGSCGLRQPGEGTAKVAKGVYVAEELFRIDARWTAGHPPRRRQANPAIPFDQSNTFDAHCSASQVTDLSGPLGQVEPLRHRTTEVIEAAASMESGSTREANACLRVELRCVFRR
jgi:hypothetical protein